MHPRSRVLSRSSFLLALMLLAMRSGDLTSSGSKAAVPRDGKADLATEQRVNEQYGRLPLSFEKNQGQTDPRVEFLSRGLGYALFLSAGGETVFALSGTMGDAASPRVERAVAAATDDGSAGTSGAVLRLTLVGARPDAHAEGREPLPGAVNYLRGTDRTEWRTGIRTYAQVAYEEVYPGVDLVYYGNQRQLEYDFIVRPGADPRVITLDAEGADRVEVDAEGDLVLHVGTREVRQRKPVVYQERQGARQAVEGRYLLQGPRRVAFHVGHFDPALPLIIDPVLVYSTYLGGAFAAGGVDDVAALAVDSAGHALVVGSTASTDFPTTAGSYDASLNGRDVFVTKLDPSGTTLAYSTFLGGSENDDASDVAVDQLGNAYVTGVTQSSDFPTTSGAYDRALNGGWDVFVTKLDPAGATLVYSTFLGGSSDEPVSVIAVDDVGQAHVGGTTGSTDFPTTPGAFDRVHDGSYDAFVAKLDPSASTLRYSTLLGGTDYDWLAGIVLDTAGNAVVGGQTQSPDFPTTPGAYDNTLGQLDVFVTRLDAAGALLTYSTFLGGSAAESGVAVAIDASGMVYLAGQTTSSDFPTTAGAYDSTLNGNFDVFVTKFDLPGSALAYSTFLGGSDDETADGIAVDEVGSAYVTGRTWSSDFPVTPGAFDTTFSGSSPARADGFVTKLDSSGAILAYSTFLGSPFEVNDIAVASGRAYIVGDTQDEFPTTPGAYDRTLSGDSDAFVTSLDATGSSLQYSTYLGGRLGTGGGDDRSVAVAVDGTGSTYIAGSTMAPDFPTTHGAYDPDYSNGSSDAFVTKLDADGTALVYSTFLGGRSRDEALQLAVDDVGNTYVTGVSASADFPTTSGAYRSTFQGPLESFVTKLDASGAALIYSTFLSIVGPFVQQPVADLAVDGQGNAYLTGENFAAPFYLMKLDAAGARVEYYMYVAWGTPFAVAVDSMGQAYVTGSTGSGSPPFEFPTTPGAFDTTYNGGTDAFVTKVNSDGTAFVYSTFLGGTGGDNASGIVVDGLGYAYVTGATNSVDFPTTSAAFDRSHNGATDVFVTKLDPAGAALMYSGYLGGRDSDQAAGIAVDERGQAHLTGVTSSIDFPTTTDAFDNSWNYSVDAFVSVLDVDGTRLMYSTYLGGTSDDVASGIAVDGAGNSYLVGYTSSPNFPTTPGAFDPRHDSTQEAFVVKLGDVGGNLPGVNITANGLDGPLPLVAADPLAIAVSFNSGSLNIVDPAEVFIGVTTPRGRLWFDPAAPNFVAGLRPAYTGPLAGFGPATIVDLPNVSSLPAGQYWWFVWVDYDVNGVPNGGTFDVVLTTVR